MAQEQNENPVTFVNVKRVAQEQDSKGRDRTKLTFGLGKTKSGEEVNELDMLIDTLEQYRGKQVNFDIRVDKTSEYPRAFVMISEMIPKSDPRSKRTASFAPKTNSKTTNIKATADKIRRQVEG